MMLNRSEKPGDAGNDCYTKLWLYRGGVAYNARFLLMIRSGDCILNNGDFLSDYFNDFLLQLSDILDGNSAIFMLGIPIIQSITV